MQIDAAALASLSRVPGFPSRTAPFPPALAPTLAPLPSFWTAHYTSPFQDTGATDPLPHEADVVVIGSGLTGVSAVDELVRLHLASSSSEHTREEEQPTLRIVVLEARTFCSGATGRNGGHLTAYPIARFGTLCARWGVDEAKRAVRLEEEGVRWVLDGCEREDWTEDVELRSGKGTLVMFDTPEQVHEVEVQLALAAEAGEDVGQARWVSSKEAMETYGAKTFRALLVPGNTLYPLKLVTKLFGRASSRVEEAAATTAAAGHRSPISLDLYTHCLVDAVEQSPDLRPASKPTWLVRTARGTIKTSHVLHATNAYASHALPSLASPSFSAGRKLPTRAQMLELVPSTPPKREEAWANAFSSENAPRNSTYFFQRAVKETQKGGGEGNVQGGEILIGGMRERVPGMEWGVADDGALNPVVGDALRGAVGDMFPSRFGHEGEGLRVGMEWTGVLGYREEGNPMVGPIHIDGEKQDGQWIATSDGVGRPDTRLDEEGEVEGGWLWPACAICEISAPTSLPPEDRSSGRVHLLRAASSSSSSSSSSRDEYRPSHTRSRSPAAPRLASPPVRHPRRTMRWTAEECADVLAVGDAYIEPGGNMGLGWEELRSKLTSAARERSVGAVKSKYLQLTKERKKEDDALGEGQASVERERKGDLVVSEEEAGPSVLVPVSSGPLSPSAQLLVDRTVAATHAYIAGAANPFADPPPPPPSAEWTIGEDAALLTAMCTAPIPLNWQRPAALISPIAQRLTVVLVQALQTLNLPTPQQVIPVAPPAPRPSLVPPPAALLTRSVPLPLAFVPVAAPFVTPASTGTSAFVPPRSTTSDSSGSTSSIATPFHTAPSTSPTTSLSFSSTNAGQAHLSPDRETTSALSLSPEQPILLVSRPPPPQTSGLSASRGVGAAIPPFPARTSPTFVPAATAAGPSGLGPSNLRSMQVEAVSSAARRPTMSLGPMPDDAPAEQQQQQVNDPDWALREKVKRHLGGASARPAAQTSPSEPRESAKGVLRDEDGEDGEGEDGDVALPFALPGMVVTPKATAAPPPATPLAKDGGKKREREGEKGETTKQEKRVKFAVDADDDDGRAR
ncbi:hypothetical protein Rhopal_007125-T1 [Rhodotorula paludigena]|uniref:FAD dependent oxidoreductase domain-containing protein n=1 Tax=Rhodotorula paludigena TaxID=86838 RepID=A0AAV5GX41_9BASI|nr:hypothetical protein Rhopal_007125-T1 [Rhodotorula paludigena]